MTQTTRRYRKQVMAELDAIPPEYLPFLVQMVRSFRNGVALKPAAASFRQGWQEAQRGETVTIKKVWEDIDAE